MTRKEIRQKHLADIILKRGYIPKTGELAEILGVTERTIERDLKDLCDLIPDKALEEIKTGLMLKLRDRIPEMQDRDLIKLAEFFLAKRTRVDSKVESDKPIILEMAYRPEKQWTPEEFDETIKRYISPITKELLRRQEDEIDRLKKALNPFEVKPYKEAPESSEEEPSDLVYPEEPAAEESPRESRPSRPEVCPDCGSGLIPELRYPGKVRCRRCGKVLDFSEYT